MSMIDTDKREILEAIGSLAEQTQELKQDVHGVKVEVQELKGDVYGLKEDVGGLKGDVLGLKKDTQELKEGRNEILEAIQAFAEQNDRRFDCIESDIGLMKSEMVSMKSQMVTKDYLDSKLSDLRSDLIVLTRKENTKLSVLVEELVISKSLSRKSADRILLMEPFSNERTR